MHGLIITNQIVSSHIEYKVNRLIDEFSKLNVKIDVMKNDGTIAMIENSEIVINISMYDFVIYMDKDIYLARLLEKSGYRLFNTANFIKLCDDKMLTYIYTANKGIKMIKTISNPLVYYDLNSLPYESFLKHVEKELGYPLIMKRVYGSLGIGVYLINNYDELVKAYKKHAFEPLIFQEYQRASRGYSIRVIVIDGQVIGAFKRINGTDFRSNYSDSASSTVLDNPTKYLEFAQNIAEKLQIEYAGIDLLDDVNGQPILCEINSNAFFEEFEKVTGINVASQFAKMVLSKVRAKKEETDEKEIIF